MVVVVVIVIAATTVVAVIVMFVAARRSSINFVVAHHRKAAVLTSLGIAIASRSNIVKQFSFIVVKILFILGGSCSSCTAQTIIAI
jgi:hypothetical protein